MQGRRSRDSALIARAWTCSFRFGKSIFSCLSVSIVRYFYYYEQLQTTKISLQLEFRCQRAERLILQAIISTLIVNLATSIVTS